MSFIKFTMLPGVNGDYVYIESSKIESFFRSLFNGKPCTVIQAAGVNHRVMETEEEIIEMLRPPEPRFKRASDVPDLPAI